MSGIYRGPGSSVAAETVNLEGDKGDITVTNAGETWTIDNDVVTFAKMQNVSTDTLLGRSTASDGNIETITCTSVGRALLDDTTVSAQRTTLGLGDIAVQNSSAVTITGGTISGITDIAVTDGGTGASLASDARTNLGLAIGTDVLAYDANLQSFVNTFTLPTVDSTDGYYLKTDGAGNLAFQAPGGIADGDYGDITVSASGATWNLDAGVVGPTELASNAVETAKIADLNVTTGKLEAAVFDNLTTVTAVSGDYVAIADTSDSGSKKKALISDIVSLVPTATDTTSGTVELATTSEVQTGTDTARSPSVSSLRQGLVVNGTTVTLTNQTAVDFTVPSWVTTIFIKLGGVSTTGASPLAVFLGDAGGIEASGYSTSGGDGGTPTSASNGFLTSPDQSSNAVRHGIAILSRLDSSTNTWSFSSTYARSDTPSLAWGAGSKSLSGEITTVRVGPYNGTDQMDSGSLNISFI